MNPRLLVAPAIAALILTTPGTTHATTPTVVLIPPLTVHRPPALLAASRDFLRPPIVAAHVPANGPVAVEPQASPPDAQPPAMSPSSDVVGRGQQPTRPQKPPIPADREGGGPAGGEAAAGPLTAAQDYARGLVGPAQFRCLDALWTRESHWNPLADNPHSTAYGIGQLLTETSHDWRVQVDDGVAYVAARYGDACAAWAFWRARQWY